MCIYFLFLFYFIHSPAKQITPSSSSCLSPSSYVSAQIIWHPYMDPCRRSHAGVSAALHLEVIGNCGSTSRAAQLRSQCSHEDFCSFQVAFLSCKFTPRFSYDCPWPRTVWCVIPRRSLVEQGKLSVTRGDMELELLQTQANPFTKERPVSKDSNVFSIVVGQETRVFGVVNSLGCKCMPLLVQTCNENNLCERLLCQSPAFVL